VSRPTPEAGGTDGGSVTLSTGETVGLPLVTEATMTGAALGADRSGVAELLPAGLAPVPTGPGRAAVALLCVEYDRIGEGEIPPYNEFGVLVPAIERSASGVPYAAALSGGAGAYVWTLPVTNEPGRALGVEIWGYPKRVARITHQDHGRRRRTTVRADGEAVLTLDVRRPPTVSASVPGASYTERDGALLREPLELDGAVGAWPYSGAVSLRLGGHPLAERLSALDLGERALARFAAEGKFTIHAGRVAGD